MAKSLSHNGLCVHLLKVYTTGHKTVCPVVSTCVHFLQLDTKVLVGQGVNCVFALVSSVSTRKSRCVISSAGQWEERN
jgi:hypothetical protein